MDRPRMQRQSSGFMNRQLASQLQQIGNLQKKEAIKRRSLDIINKTRDVDGLITKLFSAFCLNSSDKEKLDIQTVSEDKLTLLVEMISNDEKGDKADKFMQALLSSSNDLLCEILVLEGRTVNQKWLEIQKMGRELIQQHFLRLCDSLRDIDGVIIYLKPHMVLTSCRGQTRLEKVNDLIKQVQKGDIQKVCYFVTSLRAGVNDKLFKLIQGSEKMSQINEQLQEVRNDMVQSVKEKLCNSFKDIIPIPGNLFHMDMIKDRGMLLKLHGLILLPRKRQDKQVGDTSNWSDGEEVYRISNADKLFTIRKHRLTVVQGDPGTGKTVFLQRWAVNWATDHENNSKFIIFIPMRSVQSKTLVDIIFNDLVLIGKEFREAFQYFLKDADFQKEITFLVDGVDENISGMEESEICRLISGKLLPNAEVVVTTRMYQSILQKLKPWASAVITLTGVTEQSRESFIGYMLGNKAGHDEVQSFIKRCKEFLFDNTILGIPIYLTLLCVLALEHCNDSRLDTLAIPQTRLDMYNTFAEVFEKRYCATSYPGCVHIEGYFQHTAPLIKYLIGRMSFYKLAEGKHDFTVQDLHDNFLEESLIHRIGYFIEVRRSNELVDRMYMFCHKTFQEYFAGTFCANIGFPKTAMHLMSLEKGMFNNQRILAGLDNVCLQKEWRPLELTSLDETKTLEDSMYQVMTAMQFASGMSPDFARSVFLYGICACHLQVSTDKYGKPVLDTDYETSLAFESQDSQVLEDYGTYLLNVRKHPVLNMKTMIPDNYSIAMYRYISKSMPVHLKCKLLKEVYSIEAAVSWDGERHSILTKSKDFNTDDPLLSYLLKNEMPSVIRVLGADANVQVVTNVLRQNDSVKHLEIGNTDLSVVPQDLWEEFFGILESRRMLEGLKLTFCNLQSNQMENIFYLLNNNKAVKFIDISGNRLGNVTDRSLEIIGPAVEQHITKVVICHSFVQEHDWVTSTNRRNVVHNDVYIASFARFLKINTNLKELSIDQSFLKDFQSEKEWKTATERLKNCRDLETLRITGCRLNGKYHLQNLCTTIQSLQLLRTLHLSHNNFCSVGSDIWSKFTLSLSQLRSLSHLKLAKCGLVQNYHIQHLGKAFESLKDLECLDISRNSFGNCSEDHVISFVQAFKYLDSLQELDVSRCELRNASVLQCLGDAFCVLESLTYLNFSGNCFNKIDQTSWSRFLKFQEYTKHLTTIKMSGCGLTQSCHIEETGHFIAGCTKLESIDLSHNNLNEISNTSWRYFCTALTRKTALMDINLMECHISKSFQVCELANALTSCRNLRYFNFERNSVQHIPTDSWHIFMLALSKTSIQKINIVKCGLQQDHFESSATCLNKFHSLISLDVSQNGLGRIAQHDWTIFISGIKDCHKLREINLSKNSLCGEHITGLGELLGCLTQSLVCLNLRDNSIGESDNVAWNCMMEGLGMCTKLKDLSISRCKVHGNYQVQRLGSVIHNLIHLETLDISQNDICVDETSWLCFAVGIKTCRMLRKVNFDNCKLFQGFHYKNLGACLATWTYLQYINLSGNNMNDIEHCKDVFHGLNWCKQLKVVKMSNCSISSDEHIHMVIPVLISLPRLTELNLSRNNFQLSILKHLIQELSSCDQLRAIDLHDSHINLAKKALKWHTGDDGTTVKAFAKTVLDKINGVIFE